MPNNVNINGFAKYIILSAKGAYTAEGIYSDWKEWASQSANAGFTRAFDTIGGDNVGGNQEVAPYFFLRNDAGWLIKMPEQNGEIVISGNLFPRDTSGDMFVQSEGYDAFLRLEVSTRAVVIRDVVTVPTEVSALTEAQETKLNSLDTSNLDVLVSSRSTFDHTTNAVETDENSRTASKADVRNLSTFDPITDTVANVTTVATNMDMRGTDNVTIPTNLSTFDPDNDTVANVTLVGTVTTNTDMRGTDGANTVAPNNTSIETILTNLTAYTTATQEKIRQIILDTQNLQENQSDWVTADISTLSTFDHENDEVTTDTESREASRTSMRSIIATQEDIEAKVDAIEANTSLIPATL